MTILPNMNEKQKYQHVFPPKHTLILIFDLTSPNATYCMKNEKHSFTKHS